MSWEEGVSIPTRQRCGVCRRVSPVGFHVPDALWRVAVPDYFRETPMCIVCFASFADERMLAWDMEIRFFPMSLVAHLRAVRPAQAPDIPAAPPATPAEKDHGLLGNTAGADSQEPAPRREDSEDRLR